MPHAHLDPQETYGGDFASQKRYVYGLQMHLRVTPQGHPVEGLLTPGSSRAGRALRSLQCAGPAGRVIDADKA
jgi:hypothetical protein